MMNRFIAFLRGINVGGHRKMPMAELRSLLSTNGLIDVKSYIQSGNVVFKSEEDDITKLKTDLEMAILSKFKFEVPILLMTEHELIGLLERNPFDAEKLESCYYILPFETIGQGNSLELSEDTYPDEHFLIKPNCIYLHAEKGYGKARCNSNFFERKLKITATARNHKTMLKLVSLSAEN